MADLVNDNRIYRLLKSILSATVADVGRTKKEDHDENGRWAKKDGGSSATQPAATKPQLVDDERFNAALNEDKESKLGRLRSTVGFDIAKEQDLAIKAYTGNGYTSINKYLRAIGTNPDGTVKKGFDERDEFYEEGYSSDDLIYNDATIENLEKFINDHPLKEDTMLYRTCGRGALTGQYFDLLLEKHIGRYSSPEQILDAIVGQVGADKGFMSTGYAPGSYLENLFEEEIFAPKGTPAALVEPWSSMPFEAEVLVQRNMKKVVTGWEKKQRKNGTVYYAIKSQIVL